MRVADVRKLRPLATLSAVFFLLFTASWCATASETSGSPAQISLEAVSYYGRLLFDTNLTHTDGREAELTRMQGGEVILSNALHTFRVPTKEDGSFVLYNIPYGTYYLHGEYANFVYPTVRVDVTQKTLQGAVRPHIRTYENGALLRPLRGTGLDESSPALIPFMGMLEYYVPREEYSLWGFVKNPVVLMMILSMVLMGMMRLIPEEERRESMVELQRMRKQLSGQQDKAVRERKVK
ncbi:putative Protein of unknown function (DUF2012) [Trypanosoma vivax]|uniref:ER membrane protein complex subunit 7 beta-sandwich domain-containing protein n=1 Tax=Trypanosoma vivax (strain Y486) TaxID=1055687 RepID=G0TXS6_TRYVY|nr:hypothetical protein TRVL_08628 [Trypanosoma vivax]KAH8612562.1 putative Protein of unknown function (DUF2012) [Trypanosoma vivax]CCC48768.1 conserved hypothetical protein [Trypanosoma vivax Y486]